MAKLANRAKMTISSTGTGNITLAAADTGYQTFAQAGISDGDVIRYIVEDASNAWEIGTAVVSNSSTVLARTVEESSNGGSALNLTSAAKVFVGITAKDLDGNVAPQFLTTPPTSLTLANDGSTAATLNVKAYDEQGFPVNYSWDANIAGSNTIYDASSLPPQFASAPSINQSTGVFSIIGSSNTANGGTVNFRAKASDGVMTSTHVAAVKLSFLYTTGLLGYYDANDSNSYTNGSSSWNDISGNSGPTLPVDTADVTFLSNSTGGLPTIDISNEEAINANFNLGTGCTVVMICHATGSISSTEYFAGKYDNGGSGRYFNAGTNTAYASINLGSNAVLTTSSKLYYDKTQQTIQGEVANGALTRAGFGNLVYASGLHSFAFTDVDLTTGFSSGGSSSSNYPPLKIRAILFYDHEVSASNVAVIHDYFKGDYASDSDMPA